MILSTRPIQQGDLHLLINYWLTADEGFLRGMGADINKVPSREQWEEILTNQINTPLEQKRSYCIIWLMDKEPVGHSNASDIIFGKQAHMHLHLWNQPNRRKGLGTSFVKLTLPYFFHDLKIKTLYCEPYALNPAPNHTLSKIGFSYIKKYTTTPGWINFEQPVKRWKLTSEDFNKMI